MNPSLIDKLEGLRERYAEVGALLAEPEVASDPSRLRSLAREHAELGPIVECFDQLPRDERLDRGCAEAEVLASDDGPRHARAWRIDEVEAPQGLV